MGFIFPDYQTFIIGEELHASISSMAFNIGLVIALLEGLRNLIGAKRQPNRRKLQMRKLKNITGEFLAKGATHSNPLFKEDNFRFFVMADKIDFAVMKLVSTDVPLLAAQEHQHAKLHHLTTKVTPETNYFTTKWVEKVFDAVYLRTPTWIMAGFCLLFESMTPIALWFGAVNPLSKGMYSNLMVFHGFEEIEHATVTVHYLKELCPFPARVVLMVLFGFIFELALVIPLFVIPCTMYTNPEIIYKPRTYLIDIPTYFIEQMIAQYVTMPWIVVHFLFAIPHYDFLITHFKKTFEVMMKERGFEWEVTEEKVFTLDHSLHAKAPKTNKFLDVSFYWALPLLTAAYHFADEKLGQLHEALDVNVLELWAGGEQSKPAGGERSKPRLSMSLVSPML